MALIYTSLIISSLVRMLLLAFLIGFFAGLRSLTAPAATAWAVYLGWLRIERALSLIGSFPSAATLTLRASLSSRGSLLAAQSWILSPSLPHAFSGCSAGLTTANSTLSGTTIKLR